jgi:hypothetical protein
MSSPVRVTFKRPQPGCAYFRTKVAGTREWLPANPVTHFALIKDVRRIDYELGAGQEASGEYGAAPRRVKFFH